MVLCSGSLEWVLQTLLGEDDKEKSDFICPLGFYQFERMLKGILGARTTFQRLMENMVGDMNLLEVLVDLDYLSFFGKILEEHETRLLKVLDHLQAFGLKCSLDKCASCQTSVKYMGRIVSKHEISPEPNKCFH